MRSFRAWGGIALIFICGMVCGAVLTIGLIKAKTRQAIQNPGRNAEKITNRLTRELKLDPAQTQTVRETMLAAGEDFKRNHTNFESRVNQVTLDAIAKIRTILRPDQLSKFDTMVAKEKAKREKQRVAP